jgi:YD repeat-containing protein
VKFNTRSALAALVVSACALQAVAETKSRTTSYEYNAQGKVTKAVVEPDSPNDCLQTSYGYDLYGNVTSESQSACAGASGYTVYSAGAARTSTTSWGEGHFPVTVTNALGQSEARAYDSSFGTLTSLTGPNGLATHWQYDAFGRKSRETRGDGTYTTWSYKLCSEGGANCPGAVGPGVPVWVLIEQGYAVNGAVNAPEKRAFHDRLGRAIRLQTQGFDGSGAAPAIVEDTEYNSQGLVARKSRRAHRARMSYLVR